MLTEPADLDLDLLVRELERGWGLRGTPLEYLPVGAGSHHWRAGGFFVSVDDLAAGFQAGPNADASFAALRRAYATAAALRAARLEFVVAPLPDRRGEPLRRLSSRYAVNVTLWIEGESSQLGAYRSEEERREAARLVARLHQAGALVPERLPREDTLTIPARDRLEQALDQLGRTWTSGPLAEPARELLAAAKGLRGRLAAYDALAARVRSRAHDWVVTHGEPHRANLIRLPDGGLRLVDWDTTLRAPRERDLRMVLDDELTGWDEYAAAFGGRVELDRDALQLLRDWWPLADLASYLDVLRRPHERTAETERALAVLGDCL